ncbi:MAG: DUF4292 domain-containing protein [Thermoanaerobaculia bacterium]|nr:DUF4292 domain-containing protein [Thermoanaerobaculia bacterium]
MKLTLFQYPLIWAFFLLLFTSARHSGCRNKERTGDEIVPATTVRSSDFLLKQLRDKNPDALKSLTARAKIYAEGDGMAVEANANLVWIRDSALWLNVKKLGIEAVRALITRDSVIVINRLENTYTAQDLGVLQRQYSLPEGFPLLQNLVLASAWVAPDMLLQADIKDSLHRLSGANQHYAIDYRIEEGSFHLRRETFVQQRDARILTLEFDQFKKLPGAGFFPYLRRIEAFSPDNGPVNLQIEFTDVEINTPATYRFEIPAHYRRAE